MNIDNSSQCNKYNQRYYSQSVPPLNPTSHVNPYLGSTPVLTTSPHQHQFDMPLPYPSSIDPNYTESNGLKTRGLKRTNIASSVSCNLRVRPSPAQPKHHRGKRKAQAALESCKGRTNSRSSETAGDPEPKEDEEEKLRSKNLERNRLAAYKCRQRKKEWLDKLARKAERMTKENEHLRETLLQLKEETIYLKTQLMMHEKTCEKKAYFPSLY